MSIVEIGKDIVLFIELHQKLGWILVLLLSCAESLVIVSLLFPATIILVTFSSLLTQSPLSFTAYWVAATLGAFLGDFISYLIGYYFGEHVFKWPFLNKYQQLQQKTEHFFIKWGFWAIFIGRFFGPLRAIMPFTAGVSRMNNLFFQLANIFSAMLWGWVVLAPGILAFPWLRSLI